MPSPEKANSVILVRPMGMKPAARRRATAGASCLAAGASFSTIEPDVVTPPAMSHRSLIETGMPANGEGAAPRAQTVAVISCCQRFLRMNLQKDTLPFSRLIRDPRQALLHEAAAFHGTAEISCELEERGHCL